MTKNMTILPPPDKSAIEIEVSDQFKSSDIDQIARFVQRDSSLVSRLLSPNCDHKNHVVYFFLLFLWAFDCVRRELGDYIVALILRERAKWLADAPKIYISRTDATKEIGDEFLDFWQCEANGKSADELLKELDDIAQKVQVKRDLLIEQRTKEKFGR